jgi:spore maturation protein CgeB
VDRVYIAQKPFLEFYPKEKTSYLPLACDPEKHCRRLSESRFYDIGFIGNDTYPPRRQLLEVLNVGFNLLWTTAPPGDPYARLLSQCDLTFNRSLDRDVNMRFFEAIASGRMLLTDYLPAQDEIAVNGVHYVSYSGARDLVQKASYYLANNDERERIALAGARHMVENHTYTHRLLKIFNDFDFNIHE